MSLLIGAVIVTYNRLEKLKIALMSYSNQEYPPTFILVVDNNSSDGTQNFLNSWKNEQTNIQHMVIRLESNLGGSGGFYYGIQKALDLKPDWIWVSDDDAYLKNDCFKYLVSYIESSDRGKLAAVCSSVISNKKFDTWHRRILKRKLGVYIEERIPEEIYRKKSFELTFFSYVGLLMNSDAILKVGLPNKDFFISYDDSEHSMRLAKVGQIVCIPKAQVVHDTTSEDQLLTWKKYYAIRNKVYSYRMHFGKVQAFILALYYLGKSMNNIQKRKITATAINDAYRKKMGIHCVYHPGWTNEK